MSDLQPRGNQVRILDSRAAVYVQLGLISIAYYHVSLRESEYLLKAAATNYTQWEVEG